MALDIALIQAKYGANTTFHTGDDTYTLQTANGIGTQYRCIWDAGGTDTISAAAATVASVIDLNAATLKYEDGGGGFISYVTGIYDGLTIAHNVVIENAVGGSEGDTLKGNAAANVLTGNGGADHLIGNDGADHLFGNDGNDALNGGPGDDELAGGSGEDTADYQAATAVTVNLTSNGAQNTVGAGSDTLTGIEDVIGSATGDDNLTGDGFANVLMGLGGNDTLDGGAGSDMLDGELGNDTYAMAAENDVIVDASGIDTITSTITRSLAGFAAIEKLTLLGTTAINGTGNGLANTITGNGADNILDGGLDNDALMGGAGNDTYVLANGADTVTDTAGIDTITSTITRSLASFGTIEKLTLLGTAAINGTGNGLVNTITGNTGANILDGGLGNDKLLGGAGNDTYVLANGADTVTDTAGIDTITSTVTRSLAGFVTIEHLTLLGTAAINGTGNAAANIINGTNAVNTLAGMAGNDTLNAAGGNDLIIGGLGKDTMNGGLGSDRFDFNTVAEIGKGITRDVIAGFTHLTDKIDLGTIDANGAAGGHTFAFLAANNAAFTGVAGQLRWFRDDQPVATNDKTIIEGDIDGNKVFDFQIQLAGLKSLTAADFVL